MVFKNTNIGRLIHETMSLEKTASKINFDPTEAVKVANGLEKIASYDYNEKVYSSVTPKIKQDNVFIHLGDTITQLPIILDKIPQNENILFWLEAHLPDFTDKDFISAPRDTKIPLKKELEAIKNKRYMYKDFIICDDLRIYEDGPFQHGCWSGRLQFGDVGTSFISEIFLETHDIYKLYNHEGYIYIIPKEISK